jgi:hypothetical protein
MCSCVFRDTYQGSHACCNCREALLHIYSWGAGVQHVPSTFLRSLQRLMCRRVMRVAGYDAVLGAEKDIMLNTGQLASVPGYGMWLRWATLMKERVEAGVKTSVLNTTGPQVLSAAVRVSGEHLMLRCGHGEAGSTMHMGAGIMWCQKQGTREWPIGGGRGAAQGHFISACRRIGHWLQGRDDLLRAGQTCCDRNF